MPLLFEQQTPYDGILGIWKIKEEASYFIERLDLTEEESEFLSTIKGKGRRVEWLATRYLLHHVSGRTERLKLLKDAYGKPYFENSRYHIAISHSHEMAVVLASPVPCGVDIQFPVDKIRRLVPRFCSKKEMKHIKNKKDLTTMHILWGAKECIYKAYGRKKVDYRKDIAISRPADLLYAPGRGKLKKKKYTYRYEIFAEIVLDYVLTYCFEMSEDD